MLYALDDNKNRVDAYDANKDDTYYCPICGGEVRPKQGEFNSWHFAHIVSCKDVWSYDMSEWHREWQEKYPVENREVVITSKGVSHRADVVLGKYVIEFQHSPLSALEFMERNRFYTRAGYKIVWLFDVRHLFQNNINYLNNDDDNKFVWKYAMKTLSPIVPQNWKDGIILLELSDNLDDLDEGEEPTNVSPWIAKVSWAIQNDDSLADYSRFATENEDFDFSITAENGIDLLFMNKWQRFNHYLQNNLPWHKKCGKVRGNPPDFYRCEISHGFHNDECASCKYCLIREYKKTNSYQKGGLFFYCCYPRVVSPDEDPHGGYHVESISL